MNLRFSFISSQILLKSRVFVIITMGLFFPASRVEQAHFLPLTTCLTTCGDFCTISCYKKCKICTFIFMRRCKLGFFDYLSITIISSSLFKNSKHSRIVFPLIGSNLTLFPMIFLFLSPNIALTPSGRRLYTGHEISNL